MANAIINVSFRGISEDVSVEQGANVTVTKGRAMGMFWREQIKGKLEGVTYKELMKEALVTSRGEG